MTNLPYFGVASQQVTTHTTGVLKIEGQYRGADDAFIQVHDSAAVPANGAIPIKSWFIGAGSDAAPTPFFQSFLADELRILHGLYICVSTTDGTKTLSAELMDLAVEIVESEDTVSTAGNLVTLRNFLLVGNQAAGQKKLLRVDITTGAGGNAKCLMLFAATPSNGAVPLAEFAPIHGNFAPATTYAFTFGKDGRDVSSYDAAGVPTTALILSVSNTRGTLTLNTDTETIIRAEYR